MKGDKPMSTEGKRICIPAWLESMHGRVVAWCLDDFGPGRPLSRPRGVVLGVWCGAMGQLHRIGVWGPE